MEFGRLITSETYYEGQVKLVTKDMEVSIITDRDSVLKHIIESLEPLTKGDTDKVNLDVYIDNKGQYRIIKRWSI